MSKALSGMATAGLAVAMLAGSVPASAAAKKPSAPKCSACGMTLTTKKTKMNTKAVKIGGKTYYCCSACKMGEKKPGGKK